MLDVEELLELEDNMLSCPTTKLPFWREAPI